MGSGLFFCVHEQSNSALVGGVGTSGAKVLCPKSFPLEKKDAALDALLMRYGPNGVGRRLGGEFAWIELERCSGCRIGGWGGAPYRLIGFARRALDQSHGCSAVQGSPFICRAIEALVRGHAGRKCV